MHADAFVRHALTLAPRVVMLLRLLFLESTGRRDIWDGGQLERVYVFHEWVHARRDGEDKNALALAWFVWR